MEDGRVYKALSCLWEIKGMAEQVLDSESRTPWPLIREEYEKGTKPATLARKYSIPAKRIRQKAWSQNWLNPKKLTKAVMAVSHRKYYYPICNACHHQFEATYRSAVICPTCKAAEKVNKYRSQS